MTFQPTHRIVTPSAIIPVMLCDGAAYTREEYEASAPADYERQDDGAWTFQGQPFEGEVVSTEDAEDADEGGE